MSESSAVDDSVDVSALEDDAARRSMASRAAVAAVSALYQKTLEVERRFSNPKKAAEAGLQFLVEQVEKSGLSCYDEFVFSIINQRRAA